MSWAKIALAAVLLLVVARQFRGGPHAGTNSPRCPSGWPRSTTPNPRPRWAWPAVLSGANPKNLLLAVGGAAAMAGTAISGGEQAIAYLAAAGSLLVLSRTPAVLVSVQLGPRAEA